MRFHHVKRHAEIVREIEQATLDSARAELRAIQERDYEPETSAERAGLSARVEYLCELIKRMEGRP